MCTGLSPKNAGFMPQSNVVRCVNFEKNSIAVEGIYSDGNEHGLEATVLVYKEIIMIWSELGALDNGQSGQN